MVVNLVLLGQVLVEYMGGDGTSMPVYHLAELKYFLFQNWYSQLVNAKEYGLIVLQQSYSLSFGNYEER